MNKIDLKIEAIIYDELRWIIQSNKNLSSEKKRERVYEWRDKNALHGHYDHIILKFIKNNIG